MRRVIVLTGVPASGGTTVTKKAIEKLERQGQPFKMVTYSDVMLDEALRSGWVKVRDDIRKLEPVQQRELQKIAARAIAQMATTALVVDTHATVRTPRGYLPGLPTWVLDELKPELILIVETAPNEIIRRRNADKSRQRDAQDAMAVQQHQDVNKAICMAYAAYSGATVKILQNPDGKLDQAVAELVLTLQEN
ncbi:MAG: adenylate kinase [Halobacteriota archaeon]